MFYIAQVPNPAVGRPRFAVIDLSSDFLKVTNELSDLVREKGLVEVKKRANPYAWIGIFDMYGQHCLFNEVAELVVEKNSFRFSVPNHGDIHNEVRTARTDIKRLTSLAASRPDVRIIPQCEPGILFDTVVDLSEVLSMFERKRQDLDNAAKWTLETKGEVFEEGDVNQRLIWLIEYLKELGTA